MKEKYIEYANEHFKGKALELVLKNIEQYYNNDVVISKNRYNINDYWSYNIFNKSFVKYNRFGFIY